MTASESFLYLAGQATVAMILFSMALVLWRLARGPSTADRVIAMDLLSVLVVAFLVAFSIFARETSYLDVAIAYSCIAFLGTIALARFILRTARKQNQMHGKPDDDF
jgi:multicomponent Na+:H+ antiporter subunit F